MSLSRSHGLMGCLAALLLAAGAPPLAAQQAPPTGRWELLLEGPVRSGQRGELRFEQSRVQLLLETHDTTFLTAGPLRLTGDSIRFEVPEVGFEFVGRRASDTTIAGEVRMAGEAILAWRSWRIHPSVERWPIRPRVTVAQLHLGRVGTMVEFPGAWVAAMRPLPTLDAEWRERVLAAGLPAPVPGALPAAADMALGLDRPTRAAGQQLWQELARTHAGDTAFRRLFVSGTQLHFDIHDYALAHAARRFPDLTTAMLARALRLMGTPVDPGADSLVVLGAAWALWNRQGSEELDVMRALALARGIDPVGIAALQILLEGYDRASRWWLDAVRWLMRTPWLDAPGGAASPAQLVARFWGRDTLPLPPLVAARFGGFEAYAHPGVGPIAAQLVTAASVPGADWLSRHGPGPALDAWRQILGQTDSLILMAGSTEVRLTSPAGWSRVHSAQLLRMTDMVRIDPGIAPLFAVTTIVHEWQHLLFAAERHRLLGVRMGPLGVRLYDEDPWLNEGAAEWATDAILRGAGLRGGLLRLVDAAKRRAAEQLADDSPHAIGYRLVRAAAQRIPPARLREQLARGMHDPAQVARAIGLAGRSSTAGLRLQRPLNASVVPEFTFMWETGFADDLRRTLRLPPFPSEN